MTPNQIIHDRRVRLLEHAAKVGVSAACRTFGVSRKTYYEWLELARQHGLSALMPKDRRPPVMPNATTPEEVSIILAEAVARPTLGARSLLRHLAKRKVYRCASGVQKVLNRHHLGTRAQRVAALATITAADTGLVTDAAVEGPFGFCQFASWPGQVVAMDTFYVGKLKGIGAIWQLTAIDIATRWAVVMLVVGDKSAATSADFLDHVRTCLARRGVRLHGVLTDNGPEFTGKAFTSHLAARGLTHHRIPPRSPNHNAVCERFQGTLLQEFYRPFFHRARIDRIVDLDRGLQRAVIDYNTARANHGDYMAGRTPQEVMRTLKAKQRALKTKTRNTAA